MLRNKVIFSAAALVAGALVLASSPALAVATSWSTPVNISASGVSISDNNVVVDGNGLATAVWQTFDGSRGYVASSTSLNGGAWTAPTILSDATSSARSPQLTVDANGLVTAVWIGATGGDSHVLSSTSDNGGAWSSPTTISNSGAWGQFPQVVVDANGLVTAVWQEALGRQSYIEASASLNGGSWSIPATVSASTGFNFAPQIAVDSNGLVTASWTAYLNIRHVVQSSASLNGAGWSTPVAVTDVSTDNGYPKLAVDRDGLVTAVFCTFGAVGSANKMSFSRSLSGGAWSTPAELSPNGGNFNSSQVTAGADGLVYATWYASNGTNTIAQVRTSLKGGPWSDVANLSEAGANAEEASVVVAADGLATAVWKRSNGSNMILQSSASTDGITWSSPVDVSLSGSDSVDPRLAVDANGLVTANWSNGSYGTMTAQSSAIDNVIVHYGAASETSLAITGINADGNDLLIAGGIFVAALGSSALIVSRRRKTVL